jgi:UDP-2-acetamido-3-amino-2,3-dideoxy-glucuronate N-acetyltransferase
VGDRAMLVFDDTKTSDKLVLYESGIDFVRGEPVKRTGEAMVVNYETEEPLRAELKHFLDCVVSRQQPQTDANEGVAVLEVLHRAQQALEISGKGRNSDDGKHYFVHPTAVVDNGAVVGKNTKIWHFSHIMTNSVVGEKCSIGQNVFIASNVRVGRNVKIQNNVSLYEGVVLEDDVFCGPSMVFTNIKNPRSAFPRNTSDEYISTLVRKGATLGANCTIVCGVTIGENAFVAAGAVVKDDIPAFALVAGVPAKQIGWMCVCGERLQDSKKGFACSVCSRRYKLHNDEMRLL